jgi:hypothetical protein
MTTQIPLKVVRTETGDTNGLAEMQIGESVGLPHGGTGATNASDARDNLGLASVAATADYEELVNKPVTRIYRYTISTASDSWIIQHNKNTSVFQEKLYDSNGSQFLAYVEILDANSFKVHLTESITGYVDVFFDNDELLSP